MFSSALAGMLRVGAVVLTAGALGGGVYFLVQAGDSQEDAKRLQAPSGPTATVEAPRDLSPPVDLSGPVDVKAPPTPTFPPAPIADPGIDTSDWKTYTSPLGFTLKYPPGWAAEEQEEPPGIPAGSVTIINERTQQIRALRAQDRLGLQAGEAWFEIYPKSVPAQFDADFLVLSCEPDTPLSAAAVAELKSREATKVTLAGRAAVHCFTEDVARSGKQLITIHGYNISLPSGGVLHIAAYAVDADESDFQVIRTMLTTLAFQPVP